jgi:aryl-alcohol dehydrogenase-like predicted oxidoreductase
MKLERRVLGRTGMKAGAVGFGGSETGYAGMPARQLGKILDSALDAGVNLIDTAACYGDGEEQLGRALEGRRADVFLLTKCGHAGGELGDDWEPAMLAGSIERSLKRLRTDHVDVMQLHSPDTVVLRDERVIGALMRARDAGKTRFLGISADGETALAAVAMGIFDTLQISLNIADQEAIDLVLPKARERGMGIIAKRPIANAAWRDARRAADPYARPYHERLGKLDYDFLRGDVAESIATALRFTLSAPGVACAIVGTSKPGRFEENARVTSLGPLPAAQYEAIRARWKAVAKGSWTGQR